ncbi:MAG: ABC transporter ATP-binding protein [Gammaproteobacteria bacterium]|nr:MAG: ABC transporter ATP-binding protein [Gammaproteobacteria bacterium]
MKLPDSFKPNPLPQDPTGPEGFTWIWIAGIASRHRRQLVLAQGIAMLAALASTPLPLLMPLLVDEVLLQQPGILVSMLNPLFPPPWYGPMLYIGAIFLLTIFLRLSSLGLGVWQTRQFTLISKDVCFRIRHALLLRLQRISMAEYESLGSGAVASRFVTDLSTIDDFLGASLSKTLIALLTLVGVTAVLLWMQWQLALFILFMNPLVIYFTIVLGKKVKQLKKQENSAFELFQQSLVETLEGIQQIRASNREQHYLSRLAGLARNIRTHSAAYSWKSDAAGRFSFGVFLIGFDSFRAISMLMVVFSDLTIGQMMAVFGYLWFMMAPVQELLGVQYAYYSAKAALARINQLTELTLEPAYPHQENPFSGKLTSSIKLENIWFCYRPNEWVLKGVTLDIKAGETVALVGASGGGKSTLVQIILGLYPQSRGTLSFDGIPVTCIGMNTVREHVATVLQRPAMFNDTVRNNLTLGRELDDDLLWKALETAQLSSTIDNLPLKLDTIIGKQGFRLSGGQQQRLAIARMLLSQPKIVILDESTSALDTETEFKLHEALKQELQGHTTLIIAHRLSAIRQADRVFVFEDGHIIEQGAHSDLIQAKGLYQRLYGMQ